jgi:hypothetical protein
MEQPLNLDEILEIKQYIQQYRTAEAPFDLCLSGVLPVKSISEDKAMLALYGEAGVTWWHEFVYSGTGTFRENKECIRFGPPK